MNDVLNDEVSSGIPEDFIFVSGAKKDKKDRRDFRLRSIMAAVPIPKQVFELPELFPSKNQHSRGSCTSQAQGHHKERQEGVRISAPFIMALTKDWEGNNDYGAYTRNTFRMVNQVGACEENLYPEPGPEMNWDEYIRVTRVPQTCYDSAKNHKSDSYWRVEENVDAVRQVLIEKKNSVQISMEWFSEFNNPDQEGVITQLFSNSAGGHSVEIVGFDDFKERLKIKNSWGIGWGKNGFFYMPYSVFPLVVWDCWCSLDIPAEMPVDRYYNMPRSLAGEKLTAFNPWLIKKIKRLPNNREIKGLYYGKYEFEAIFQGKYGDLWLKITKPEAIKQGLIR